MIRLGVLGISSKRLYNTFMRFRAMLVPEGPATLPEDFYAVFASFIREVLGGFDLEGEPYTFSLRLSPGVGYTGGRFEGVRFLLLGFSTGEDEVFNSVIDAVVKLKDRWEGIRVGSGNFRIGDITVEPPVRVRGDFITLSPVVVEGEGGFLLPNSPDFIPALIDSVEGRMEVLTGGRPSHISVEVKEYRAAEVPSLRGRAKGVVGRVKVRADRSTLRFLYEYGLGHRTADGFGMLDV